MLHRETFPPVKLKKLGISRVQSHRWQSIAALPKKGFEGYIRENKEGWEGIPGPVFPASQFGRRMPCIRFLFV